MKQLECFFCTIFLKCPTRAIQYIIVNVLRFFLKMSEKMIFVIPACIWSSWLQVINLSLELGNYSQKCWLHFPVILTHSWGRPALTRSSNVHWADPLLLVCCKSNNPHLVRSETVRLILSQQATPEGREGGCQSLSPRLSSGVKWPARQ